MRTLVANLSRMFFSKHTGPVLGRWSLKHNCKSEEIVVHHANRDHCGDVLCGDPKKYAEFTDLKNKNDVKINEQ